MKISKKLAVHNVVITPENVKELAQKVFDEYSRDLALRTVADRFFQKLTFTLRAEDGTQYEDEGMSIFAEGGILYTRKIISVEMRYMTNMEDKLISVGLYHSIEKNYANEVSISGNDETWVNGTLAKLSEIISNCLPQRHFITKHRFLIVSVVLISLFYLFTKLIQFSLSRIPEVRELIGAKTLTVEGGLVVIATLAVAYLFAKILSWIIGSEILAFYPNVELQLGPKHLQRESQKRRRTAAIISLVVIPLTIDLLILIF